MTFIYGFHGKFKKVKNEINYYPYNIWTENIEYDISYSRAALLFFFGN